MENLSVAAKIRDNIQELFEAKILAENAYIRFILSKDTTALFSMEDVRESLLVDTEKITPLPSMHPSVIGMMNSRDRVFCILDLAQLLGIVSSIAVPRQYHIIVVQSNAEEMSYLGLAVTGFQGMIRLSTEEIQFSCDGVSSKLESFISGTVQQNNVTIPILNFQKIMQQIATLN